MTCRFLESPNSMPCARPWAIALGGESWTSDAAMEKWLEYPAGASWEWIYGLIRCATPVSDIPRRRVSSARMPAGCLFRTDVSTRPCVLRCYRICGRTKSAHRCSVRSLECCVPGGRSVITAMHFNFRFRANGTPKEGADSTKVQRPN